MVNLGELQCLKGKKKKRRGGATKEKEQPGREKQSPQRQPCLLVSWQVLADLDLLWLPFQAHDVSEVLCFNGERSSL